VNLVILLVMCVILETVLFLLLMVIMK